MLLAFDTSTAYISVAVYDADQDRVLAAYDEVGPMKHGELLAPTIEQALRDAGLVRQDVTAVVVGVGPGPYTGLRVGVVTARALALALDVPVYGVCSLDAVAYAAAPGRPFVVTSDARRKELFWATYDEDAQRVEGPFVDKPDAVPADGLVVGAGPVLHPELFATSAGPTYPHAGDLARVVAGERATLHDPEPLYLRRPDATVPGTRKTVS